MGIMQASRVNLVHHPSCPIKKSDRAKHSPSFSGVSIAPCVLQKVCYYHEMRKINKYHHASVFARVNKDCVRALGRRACSKYSWHSPLSTIPGVGQPEAPEPHAAL